MPASAGTPPLDGLVVVDFSRVLAGPFCSMLLADFGARVIKIERPGEGDDTRAFAPPALGGESTYFLSVNRNKESLALDFKHPEGRALAAKLAERADILIENFRPGVLARIGLDPASLAERNPRLIYVSITGYGHAGLPEYARRPGYDLIAQGEGGLPSLTGPPGGPPFRFGTAIADLTGGLYATIGALLALHARERTERGQHVDVSLLDGQISLLTYQAGIFFATGTEPARHGNAHPSIVPYDTYRARDGYLNIACGNDVLFGAFAGAIGQPVLSADARFASNPGRVEHRRALAEIIEPLLARRDVDEWLELFDHAGVPCGRIASVGEALAHPQVLARGMVTSVDRPGAGPMKTLGVPVRLGATPGAVRQAPPRLGEHTGRVLREVLGIEDGELARLERAGVIGRA